MGLLHFIVRKVEGRCNVACTSKPQELHKPHKNNNIHIERILPDIEFVHEMKTKSFRVFHEIIVPEMFERKQEHEHKLKVIVKMLSDLTNKVSSIFK